MINYIALLRGINVGGNKVVAMDDLRRRLRSLGHTEVATYLQSGNAVFASPRTDAVGLGHEIELAIAEGLGLDVKVQIRTQSQLATIVADNPIAAATAEPARFHVIFLSDQPDLERFAALDPGAFPSEEWRLGDGVLYVWYHRGAGLSKLANAVLERRLGVSTTARNWNTVTKLLELAGD